MAGDDIGLQSSCSNEVTALAVFRLNGNEFQVEGAAAVKALDPYFVILFENVEQLRYLCWRI